MGKFKKVVLTSMISSMGNLGDGLIVTGLVAMMIISSQPLEIVFSLVTGCTLRALAFFISLYVALVGEDD